MLSSFFSAKQGITQTSVVKLTLLQDYSLIFLLETTCTIPDRGKTPTELLGDDDSDAGSPSLDDYHKA